MIEPALGDVERVRQVEEGRHPHADQLVRRVFRSQRAHEHAYRLRVIGRQAVGEDLRDVTAPVEQLQLIEAGAGALDEPLLRERRVGAREVGGQPPDQGRRKERLE